MILLSKGETFENIYVAVVLIVIVGIIIYAQMKKSKHMKEQKETGTDKKKVMDAMQKLMGDRFSDYTYVVGYYTKTEQGSRKVTYYYYPYILAFTSTELIIFPFLVKEGELIVRNRLDVDWKETELNSTENSKGTKLHIYLGGEMMIVNVDKVIKSNGAEKSDRPLAVYQEQEVERFINTLPQLKSLAVKK